jgi:hypothetical protein
LRVPDRERVEKRNYFARLPTRTPPQAAKRHRPEASYSFIAKNAANPANGHEANRRLAQDHR